MSDKPLTERLRDSKAHTYSSENADLYCGFDNGRESAAEMVEAFVREHLTEQIEYHNEFLDNAECLLVLAAINTQIRRIRELLVGKATK